MQRWVLVRGGLVRQHLLTAAAPTDAERRRAVFGADADDAADMAPEGVWQQVATPQLVGVGWTYAGGVYSPPQFSQSDYGRAVDAHVDAVARARGYNGAFSLASYVADPNPAWKAEADVFVAWRSAVWLAVFAELARVQGGSPAPSIAGLLALLPVIDWPG